MPLLLTAVECLVSGGRQVTSRQGGEEAGAAAVGCLKTELIHGHDMPHGGGHGPDFPELTVPAGYPMQQSAGLVSIVLDCMTELHPNFPRLGVPWVDCCVWSAAMTHWGDGVPLEAIDTLRDVERLDCQAEVEAADATYGFVGEEVAQTHILRESVIGGSVLAEVAVEVLRIMKNLWRGEATLVEDEVQP